MNIFKDFKQVMSHLSVTWIIFFVLSSVSCLCLIPQSEYEFISCGLYLVVLLHLCEQRFSDVLGAVNDAGVRLVQLSCCFVHCPLVYVQVQCIDSSGALINMKVFITSCCDLKIAFSPLSLSFSTWRELYTSTWTILKVCYELLLFILVLRHKSPKSCPFIYINLDYNWYKLCKCIGKYRW